MHTTRLFTIALAITCVACATGPGSVPASIAGNWSSWPPHYPATPAGPQQFALTESGDSVSGVGSFGGQSWSVTGKYVRPTITLTSTDGHAITWVGKALDAGKIELNGSTFYRQ